MKGLSKLLIIALFSSLSAYAFAQDYNSEPATTNTSTTTTTTEATPAMDTSANKWICTTNASASDIQAEKDADAKMANTAMSADEGFKFAMDHCRDCTKVTCEKQ